MHQATAEIRRVASVPHAAAPFQPERGQPAAACALVGGRLSDDEKRRIRAHAERGLSPGRIAWLLNRRRATVHFFLTFHGLRDVKATPARRPYLRGGRMVRGFTEGEDQLIERLRADGLDVSAIQDRLHDAFPGHRRRRNSIDIRLRMLAARAEGA